MTGPLPPPPPPPPPQPTTVIPAAAAPVAIIRRMFTISQVLAALGVTSTESFSSLMIENGQFVLETTGSVGSAIIIH